MQGNVEWLFLAFGTSLILLGSEGRGVNLGLCPDSQIICNCGASGAQVRIPIKECTYFHWWKPYCKACEEVNEAEICSRFQHCLSCTPQRDGSCESCPKGRYGPRCQGVCRCENNGICDPQSGACQCVGGYSGRFCTHREICGRNANVVPGQVNRLGEWPWQAFIAHRRHDGSFFGVCSGTLVSEDWIVTAGQCVTNHSSTAIMPLANIKIYLGKYYRDDNLDDQSVQQFDVSEIHVHPNYNPVVLDSDIALVRLSTRATLTDRIAPVCLPGNDPTGIELSEALIQPGSNITVTGWGEREDRTYANVLRTATLGTISTSSCEDDYAQAGLPLIVTSNMFCADHDDPRSDTCLLEAGGPAVRISGSGDNRRWYLVGLVSWGSPWDCGISVQYSGFTRLSQFLSFIYQFTGL